ncbi:MAG TPA: hypothetical protein VK348_10950, partial [Planctomycetota bacterium]|nr:hypothetical protein [Planctomycetota bacterium]
MPLQLGNRRIDPNVKSVHPPGTRIDLARLPAGERRWVMPGGVKLPFLNGVIDGPALAWPEGLSPAPVVAVTVDDDGMEWYVFADDSRGTCQFTWRADLKRWDPTTKVVTSVARVAWKPALPRSPLALNDRKSDPSVKSAYPPGTRIDLAPL